MTSFERSSRCSPFTTSTKLRDEQEMDEEYDIDAGEVADLVDALGVDSFAPDLPDRDFPRVRG